MSDNNIDLNIVLSFADAQQLNPQVLAFVGDAVHTLFVRTKITVDSIKLSKDLHNASKKYVQASGQSSVINQILPMLSDIELSIYKRARNYKTKAVSKGGTLQEYKHATGYEAVLGFLHLTGQKQRLNDILKMSIEVIDAQV